MTDNQVHSLVSVQVLSRNPLFNAIILYVFLYYVSFFTRAVVIVFMEVDKNKWLANCFRAQLAQLNFVLRTRCHFQACEVPLTPAG